MSGTSTTAKAYCNVLAMEYGLDPGGYAGNFETLVLLETPLPWRKVIYEQPGVLPQEVIQLRDQWIERFRAGYPLSSRLLVIAPDEDYSQDGYRRVIFHHRHRGPFSCFDKLDYLVPEDQVGPLIWTFFEDGNALDAFDQFSQPTTTCDGEIVRDILVCTHGTVEIACAKFGYPLYRHLRTHNAGAGLRVWRVNHFGGHVFAPTLMDMPAGHYWAYVDTSQADQIATRSGDPAALNGHYRGWAGFEAGFQQAAERAMWQREGWEWFDYRKECTVLDVDPDGDDPQWMCLRVDFIRLNGERDGYDARVHVAKTIETVPKTDHSDTVTYNQYDVTELHRSAKVS